MKLLHTADLHLGRQFEGRSLEEDHAVVLDQILAALKKHAVDVLIVAGDIFDRTAPPESAVRQFNDFISRVTSETDAAIVLIAGNHDSGDRIGAMATLSDRRRALVRGPVMAEEPPLILQDEHGPVAISALPFAYEFAARECFANPDIKAPEDVMRAQVLAARAQLPEDARWIVVAHAFVTGAATSDSERSLSRVVGGIETVPSDVFDGAAYVALGHLHRPQAIGSERIRYSGSPLAFGFDEEGNEKSMALIDLQAGGVVTTELLAFKPLRGVRTLQGTLDELLADAKANASEDFVKIILTDAERRVEPMKRIREFYPNACTLYYERDAQAPESKSLDMGRTAQTSPAELVASFLEFTRGSPPTDIETRIVAGKLAKGSEEGRPA